MKSHEIKQIIDSDIEIFDQIIEDHGGIDNTVEVFTGHLTSKKGNIQSVLYESVLEAVLATGERDTFQDEAADNAKAFMQGYALGYALIGMLNQKNEIHYDLDAYYGVMNNVINLCDDLVADKYQLLSEDVSPHDVLIGTSQLGLKIRPGLEEYIDNLLDEGDLSIEIKRHKYFRLGVGLVSNYFASLEQYENPHTQIEEMIAEEKPTDEEWAQFLRSLEE